MSRIIDMPLREHARRPPDPPDNDGMDKRIEKLEEFAEETRDRLKGIETRMDTFATKEDLHRELHAQTWKFIGACVVLTGIVFWAARYVH